MNTATMRVLYPAFPDILRTAGRDASRSLPQLVQIQLRANLLTAAGTGPRYRVSIEDKSCKALRLDECCRPALTTAVAETFCPARVHAWAVAQLPAYAEFDPTSWQPAGPDETWHVTTHISRPGGTATIAYHDGTAADFAILLRGIRSYQRKQYRLARKLAAQLWQYHLGQQTAPLFDELSELVVSAAGITHGTPTVSIVGVGSKVSQPRQGLLPRLRRALAAKIHQVAVAAGAALREGGGVVA